MAPRPPASVVAVAPSVVAFWPRDLVP